MKRRDFNIIISLLLLLSSLITVALGYIQSQLELRNFVPHQYMAYSTLILILIHVFLNWNIVWKYLVKKIKKQ